jgi:hypothetical protein
MEEEKNSFLAQFGSIFVAVANINCRIRNTVTGPVVLGRPCSADPCGINVANPCICSSVVDPCHLVRIRIRGSCSFFVIDLHDVCLLLFEGTFSSFFDDQMSQ